MENIFNAISNNIDKADKGENEIWHLTRACSGLFMIAKAQQASLARQTNRIAALEAQVAKLQSWKRSEQDFIDWK